MNVVWPGRPAQATSSAPPSKKQKGKQREVNPGAGNAASVGSPLDVLSESERQELERSTRMAIKRVFSTYTVIVKC